MTTIEGSVFSVVTNLLFPLWHPFSNEHIDFSPIVFLFFGTFHFFYIVCLSSYSLMYLVMHPRTALAIVCSLGQSTVCISKTTIILTVDATIWMVMSVDNNIYILCDNGKWALDVVWEMRQLTNCGFFRKMKAIMHFQMLLNARIWYTEIFWYLMGEETRSWLTILTIWFGCLQGLIWSARALYIFQWNSMKTSIPYTTHIVCFFFILFPYGNKKDRIWPKFSLSASIWNLR